MRASDCSGVIGPLRCSSSATSQSRNHASPRSPDSVASGFKPGWPSGADFGVAAAKGADGHFEARFLVEDDRPAPCPLGLGREEGDGRGLAAAGFAEDEGVAVGRLGRRIAGFVEAEPVQRALQRLEQRERRLPWQACGFRPGIGGMQRRHIGEVQGRDRHVPRPVVHIAGVHGEEGGLKGCDLADQPHAVLMRDAADAGDFGVECRLITGKDGDGHLVDAKPELAAFGFVGGLEELGLDRGGDVLGGPHLRDAAFHPFGDAAALDRRVAVGDDGVAADAPSASSMPGQVEVA